MNSRGFVLAELLVALAVLGLLLAGMFVVQEEGHSAYLMGVARVEAQQNTRAGLDRLLRELRLAETVTAAPNCGTLSTGATDITFTFVDETGTDVTVRYDLSGSTVRRNQTVPVPATPQPEAVIGGVSTLKIWCYGGNDVLTATPAQARSIRVSVATAAANGAVRQHVAVESRVRLRNAL
jgi:prepilin-type N-terminal cleavage/methylation domain-containing protein